MQPNQPIETVPPPYGQKLPRVLTPFDLIIDTLDFGPLFQFYEAMEQLRTP